MNEALQMQLAGDAKPLSTRLCRGSWAMVGATVRLAFMLFQGGGGRGKRLREIESFRTNCFA
jgi:hypothetical protein